MVVVASVEVPSTVNVPVVVAPSRPVMKLRFSTQAVPFQYNVLPVAVPLFTVPVTEAQNVDVPFVARYCPNVPVALLVSRSSPVRRSLSIVVEASIE
jgi:hypothetical protein